MRATGCSDRWLADCRVGALAAIPCTSPMPIPCPPLPLGAPPRSTGLRMLATTRLGSSRSNAAADVLVLLEPALAELAWRAERALERADTVAQ
jgi:hypothetical protein